MARYVESAILRIEDQASAEIAKVRKNLQRFAATNRSLQAQLAKGTIIPGMSAGSSGGFRKDVSGMRAQAKAATNLYAPLAKLSQEYLTTSANASALARTMGKVTAQMRAQSQLQRTLRDQRPLGRMYGPTSSQEEGGGRSGKKKRGFFGRDGIGGLPIGANIKQYIGYELTNRLVGLGLEGIRRGGRAVADYSNQIANLKVEGLDAKGIAEIENAAEEISRKVPQVSKGEAIARIREARGNLGDWHEAAEFVKGNPDAQRYLKARTGDAVSGAAEREAYLKASAPDVDAASANINLGKAAESLIGSKLLTKEGAAFGQAMQNAWAQVLNEQKGNLQPEAIKQMVLKSMGSLRGKYNFDTQEGQEKALRDIGVYYPILAGELGGQSTGTMLNSMSRSMSGRMSDESKGFFEKLGLLDESKIVSRNKQGDPHKLAYGAFKGFEGKNLFEYLMETVGPALEKAGYMDDPEKREWALNKIFSNQKTAGSAKTMMTNYKHLKKSHDNLDQAKSVGEGVKIFNADDVQTNIRNLQGAATTAIQSNMSGAIPIMNGALQAGTWMMQNPSSLMKMAGLGLTMSSAAGMQAMADFAKNPSKSAGTMATVGLTAILAENTAAVAANTAAIAGKAAVDTSGSLFDLANGKKTPGTSVPQVPPPGPEKPGRMRRAFNATSGAAKEYGPGLVKVALPVIAAAAAYQMSQEDMKTKSGARARMIFKNDETDFLGRRRDQKDINARLKSRIEGGNETAGVVRILQDYIKVHESVDISKLNSSQLPYVRMGQFPPASTFEPQKPITDVMTEFKSSMDGISASISKSGGEAASTLQQQAGTIGGAIGQAAADKIQAATANVTINVNQQSAPANTGGNGLQGKK